MSDMTNDQIVVEFKRQVRLCSGIGRSVMLLIVEAQYDGKHERARTLTGEVCQKCGRGVEVTGRKCAG